MENNGRKVKIIINDTRTILSQPGISLLQALKKENVFVPSACGGRGICGLCRLRVLEGAPKNLSEPEKLHLDADELHDNFRLACQIKTDRNLRLVIPDSFFHAREFKANVSEMRELTGDIREIRLELFEPPNISFKSGQYIQLRIPPYAGNKRIVYRAYSIASPPSENSTIELEIRRVRNGIGTTYLFEHLKKGDLVSFSGPHGDFFLRDSDKPIVLIAGGSGMAPMKSMLCDIRDRKIRRKIVYFFGARTPDDVFYCDLMRSFEQTLPDFRFIPSVVIIPPDGKWEGEIGLITEVVARRMEAEFPGEVYLCGSPAMIDACITILLRKKISENQIYYDKFA